MGRKIIFVAIGILMIVRIGCSQKILMGAVRKENDTPLEDVIVSIIGVGQDVTTSTGAFRIELPSNIKVGQTVKINVIKDGWEPVSFKTLELTIPLDFMQNPHIINPHIIKMREDFVFKKSSETASESKSVLVTNSYKLTGGKIKMDIVALNKGITPIVLNQLKVNSSSPIPFICASGGRGGIHISAEYKIEFNVSKGATEEMDPPLLLSPDSAVRFIVELSPRFTGACIKSSIPFDLYLEIYSGKQMVAKTDTYSFDSDDVESSIANSITMLREKISKDSADIHSMKRLANACQSEKIAILKKVVSIVPEDLEANMGLALALSHYQNSDEVIFYFEKAIGIDSTLVGKFEYNIHHAYINRFNTLCEKRKYDSAKLLIERLVRVSPRDPDFNFLYAKLFAFTPFKDCDIACNIIKAYLLFEEELPENDGFLADSFAFKLRRDSEHFRKCCDLTDVLDRLESVGKKSKKRKK